MQTYIISEWESRVVREVFHPEDQALRLQLGQRERIIIDELKEGIRFKAKSWIGVIQFHDFQLQIIPKLAGENVGLINMLMYTAGFNSLAHYNSRILLDPQEGRNFFDLIAWLFCDACEKIAAGGLLYDYERQEDSLVNLRGRLLIDKQIRRRFGQVDRIECRFDEHSSNIMENQLLTLALYRAGLLAQDPKTRNRLRKLWGVFSEVCQIDQLDIPSMRKGILYNRLNKHYEEAHKLAWMIIDGLGIEDLYKSNKTASFAFLLDMNRLFEHFLQKYLSTIAGRAGLVVDYQRQDQSIIWDIFRDRSYCQIIPDFLLSNSKTSQKLAIDAKYKLYDSRNVDPGDIAQVFLYAYAYNQSSRPSAVIIYPSENVSTHQASLSIQTPQRISGAKIQVLGLHIPQALFEVQGRKPGDTEIMVMQTIQQAFQ